MQPDTAATLRALESVDWFHAVGKKDSPRVKVLASWMEAIVSCAAPSWDGIQHQAAFALRQRALNKLRGISPEKRQEMDWQQIRNEIRQGEGFVSGPPPLPAIFPEWEEAQSQLKPAIDELVQQKTSTIVTKEGLPHVFVSRVTCDVLHLAMECEFSWLPAGFFTAISYYYAHGHFPCGWEGRYPEGKLVVY